MATNGGTAQTTLTLGYNASGNISSSSDGRTITYSVFDQALRTQKGSEFTEFSYGLGNQLIKRVDSNIIDQVRSTWYFGSVERIVQGTGNAFFRRYVGGWRLRSATRPPNRSRF